MERYLQRIKEIATDRKHGARELYHWAVENLLEWVKERGYHHPLELVPLLAETARAQPTMAPLLNLVNRILLAWEEGPSRAQEILEEALQEDQPSTAKVVEEGVKILKDNRIVTLSRSSTLLEVMKALLKEGKRPRVLISEGRPLMEGVATARHLHKMGADVTLCTDSLIFSLMEEGDVVALGADAITPRYLVNRCGTYPLALVARDRGVAFYTFTDTGKLLPPALAPLFKMEDRDPAEVLEDAPFEIANRYFDQTPLDYITAAVTEKGILKPRDLRRLIAKTKVSPRVKEIEGYLTAHTPSL